MAPVAALIGIGTIGTLMNTFGAKHLPTLEGIVFVLHVFGWFAVIIPLWTLAPKASSIEVSGTFSNFGGWSSIGTACFVGSITATGSFAGSDAAAHLSEETKDASRSVPRMIVGTVLVNGAIGFVFIITYIVVIGTPIPLNAILFSLSMLVVIAVINIGSTAALNTIFSLLTGATAFSYALSISCLVIKRLGGEPLPLARFSMGRFSVLVNMFAVACIVVVASFFPVVSTVSAASMNWACLMCGVSH
ncbi:hypothetical protein LTR49_026037 [Elasticomyces elasticus]|nr:hypothetical protein LTR49_026037 [Elasticomyces elasticus]